MGGGRRCGRSPNNHECKNSGGQSSELKSITETAAAESSLSALFNAVKAAGLEETLSGEGNFTVFAPTNDAFDKVKTLPLLLQPMNKDLLSQILLRHVLPTRVLAGQIPRGMTTLKQLK